MLFEPKQVESATSKNGTRRAQIPRKPLSYKIEKLSAVTGDRTHNLHLPSLAYIPLVHPCASHRRNKLYICMNHYCTEKLAIFSHYQNPTSS